MIEPKEPPPIEPHPVLSAYYADRGQRPRFIRNLFNETASHYDRVDQLFSLGSGGRYRRACLRRAGLRAGLRVIDVAVGTGLVAREAVAIAGTEVVGLDLSEAMLAQARRNLAIPLIQGRAEELPLGDESIDFLSMGYALRHVSDLTLAFREFYRVLRPGGTMLLLEITKPSNRLHRVLTSLYFKRFVPLVFRWTTGLADTRILMKYFWETIDNCVPPSIIIQAMKTGGFIDIKCETQWDLLRNYVGRKP